MSNARIFFAGVGTTILLIGAGFGGGLMMAKTAMEPAPQTRATAADRLPPARVVLPASSEAATTPPPPVTEAAVPAALPQQQAQPPINSATDLSARAEKDREAERAEKRKAEAGEREQRRRLAEKAKREAARLAKQRQDQQQQNANPQGRAPIMAFGGDEQPKIGGFFGN